jgi:hypothetical protein
MSEALSSPRSYGLLTCTLFDIHETSDGATVEDAPAEWTRSIVPRCLGLAADLIAIEMISGRMDCPGLSYSNARELQIRINFRRGSENPRWSTYHIVDTGRYGGLAAPISLSLMEDETRSRVDTCIGFAAGGARLVQLSCGPYSGYEINFAASWQHMSNHMRLDLEKCAMAPLEDLFHDRGLRADILNMTQQRVEAFWSPPR